MDETQIEAARRAIEELEALIDSLDSQEVADGMAKRQAPKPPMPMEPAPEER